MGATFAGMRAGAAKVSVPSLHPRTSDSPDAIDWRPRSTIKKGLINQQSRHDAPWVQIATRRRRQTGRLGDCSCVALPPASLQSFHVGATKICAQEGIVGLIDWAWIFTKVDQTNHDPLDLCIFQITDAHSR